MWHTNLPWLMDPPSESRIDALNTTTPNLADEPNLTDDPTPQIIEQRCLEYWYTNLGRQTYFGRWTTQVIEQRCLELPVHKTWQTNLLWQMDLPVNQE